MLYLESSPDFNLGKKVFSVELEEGSTFGSFLNGLGGIFGDALAEEIYDSQRESLRDTVRAIVNGVLIYNKVGAETALNQGDAVTFVPIFAGG